MRNHLNQQQVSRQRSQGRSVNGPSSVKNAIARTQHIVETFDARLRLFLPLALIALCLCVYLPGVIRLPAVDRTEIVYAESTRDMVARGNWLDPRYGDAVHKFRPIGTYWAQGVAAKITGEGHARDIWVYRLPGLIAVTLSVLALFWLTAPVIGTGSAAMAAGLFAVAPLTVLLAQLAITEGLALLPATVAMLSLLRIYMSEPGADTRGLASLFWIALGFGILLNALQLPILIAATLIALYVFDRDLSWLKKNHLLLGLPVALFIAHPWLVVRMHQDGVPFAGMPWGDFLDALGGSQDMKLKAWPGTFLLAAMLGFLPGTALIVPAVLKLWNERGQRLARFLFAWITGYLVYLECISGKPGTYAVQVMFPAFAIAVAMLIERRIFPAGNPVPPLKCSLIPWPPFAASFGLSLFVLPYAIMREVPPVWIAPPVGAVAALFYWSAHEGRAGYLTRWAAISVAALGLTAVTMYAGILPAIDRIWPARQIQRAMEGCPAGPMSVLGFREPSAKFLLQSDPRLVEPDALRTALVEGRSVYLAGEARDPRLAAMNRFQFRRPRMFGCVEAYNVARGCKLYFRLAAAGDISSCKMPQRFACNEAFAAAADRAREKKTCD